MINSYYRRCDPVGHSEYVTCKTPLPVDEITRFRRLSFRNIRTHSCRGTAYFNYGFSEA